MEPKSIKKLSDLFGQDLAGWQIVSCYFLELDHGLMGRFPAIRDDNKEIIAVLEKRLLRWVWIRLPKRQAKITELMVVRNKENGIAFNLQRNIYNFRETKPLHVLSIADMEFLCLKEGLFRWSPGLISDDDPDNISEPDFDS